LEEIKIFRLLKDHYNTVMVFIDNSETTIERELYD